MWVVSVSRKLKQTQRKGEEEKRNSWTYHNHRAQEEKEKEEKEGKMAHDSKQLSKAVEAIGHAVAGGVAGMAAITLFYPLSSVSTR